MIELISFILVMIVLTLSVTLNVFLYLRTKKLLAALTQNVVDKLILSDKLNELAGKIDSQSIENADGFLKFVSQSRDWAFEYIEEVQNGLLKFNTVLEKAVEEKTPKLAVKEIKEASKDLWKFLPDEKSQ